MLLFSLAGVPKDEDFAGFETKKLFDDPSFPGYRFLAAVQPTAESAVMPLAEEEIAALGSQ